MPGKSSTNISKNNEKMVIAQKLSKLHAGGGPKYTLSDILQDPGCCGIFKESLDKEGTSQTLLFLMEVRRYCCSEFYFSLIAGCFRLKSTVGFQWPTTCPRVLVKFTINTYILDV